ncbi:MAG: hypothetical protein JJE50_16200 [Actinomycetales bacterium]|nr:hypothetical protein [Actinomycetales bacterium]
MSEMAVLSPGEHVVALASLAEDAPPLALGTAQGTVKRVTADRPAHKDSWEVMSLRDDDQVVGAGAAPDGDELVLVSSDGQLLHFPASVVRRQGRSAAGMAGLKLSPGADVVFFGVVRAHDAEQAQVVTLAGSSAALPGTVPGSAKVTPLGVYPAKGRATAGVRAHRFVRGEDSLYLAGVGPGPLRAVGSGGQPVDLPGPDPRRDGSGSALSAPVAGLG